MRAATPRTQVGAGAAHSDIPAMGGTTPFGAAPPIRELWRPSHHILPLVGTRPRRVRCGRFVETPLPGATSNGHWYLCH